MKITPIEIRQKTFEKNFRGYDKEEVQAFLLMLSQEWEELLEELRRYKVKLENAERELSRIREVEDSLFKTLKTAEDTGSTLIEQARRNAELKIKEAQLQAEKILNEARNQARSLVGRAEERARQLMQEAIDELKKIEADCHQLENYRDNLLLEIKALIESTAQKIHRIEERRQQNNNHIQRRVADIEQFLSEVSPTPSALPVEKEAENTNDTPPTTSNKTGQTSFFDEI